MKIQLIRSGFLAALGEEQSIIRLFKLIICLQFFAKNINNSEQKNFMSADRSSVTLK